MPVCSACNQDKPQNEFKFTYSRGKKMPRRQCLKCYYGRIREREANNPSVMARRKFITNRSNNNLKKTPVGWCKKMIRQCKSKCKKRNIRFDITYLDLLDVFPKDGNCPVFKVPLELTGFSQYNASVDKLKPELGYVKGNIAVISTKANSIKNNASADEIRRVANWLYDIEQTTRQSADQ